MVFSWETGEARASMLTHSCVNVSDQVKISWWWQLTVASPTVFLAGATFQTRSFLISITFTFTLRSIGAFIGVKVCCRPCVSIHGF